MKILGIETSCDETGAAVTSLTSDKKSVQLISSSLATSLERHAKTGGIIPEVAARNQSTYIIPVIYEALEKADIHIANNTPDIDAIAVTFGPGLIGSLLVGVETAKTLSYVWNKPLIPVNHLFGHVYANFIQTSDDFKPPSFPAIALIVSGGHTDIIYMKNHTDIIWVGGTRDDAAGECFDKCARLLGYPYPGGPKISELAKKGDKNAFSFPRPMIGSGDFEFSFSGLKTSFLNETKQIFPILRTTNEKIGWQQIALEEQITESQRQILYDLCASLQYAIIDVIVKKTVKALQQYNATSLILSGGVAANEMLRTTFQETLNKKLGQEVSLHVPPRSLCTDNAAMIAAAATFHSSSTSWKNLSANPQLYFD